ncbi:MAG: ABC transporter permease [Gemmatimonadetes bacterium]|uniref:ABC transporter permease n=1 Tax=Candidatus Kutchimonas denitrificans TaxID=3056748 RepID=A0AAE4Z870_9BACT|nr:ABC transporter permease [Gemmatimonadota bacterium]NIR75049.1 ABC transporter permease [Candidatus Kutchimonas denitrificans]NIS02869.1 ABC transporter permease [Gemmatimonadota bacterium]NIT68574.1 ABC transporter permease [Gemmatimonadota bacterium]NIU52819.1 FtsX-like permease family protein [Gemmatimonadota bacterium]
MHGILQDLRFAFRTLRKTPGYTAVALITLALGIGANTAIFSLVQGVLLRPLPYPDADRLVRIWEISSDGHVMQGAWRNFTDWREHAESLDGLTAHGAGGTSTVLGTGRPLRVGVTNVSEGFFRTIGVQPARGRAMLPEEHRLGADPAVVVSDAFWRTHLGADPDLESRRLGVSGFDVRIVGVMPPGFDYPGDIDIWYPTELNEQTDSRSAHNYAVVGRLKDDVSIEQADAELDALTAAFLDEDPSVRNETWFEGFFPVEVRLMPLRDYLVGGTRRPLLILLGASGLLLLIACTNLASATLARGTTRERELAVRLSLGAGRGRVIRQLYTESLALALAGAALGVGLAFAVVRTLPTLAPDVLPRMDAIGLNPAVLAFTVAVALATAVLFGLLPALRLSRDDLATSLRSGGARGGTERAQRPVWRWLVASEIALAIVLLVGCGLLIRSFYTVLQVRPGFRTEGVLTATVNPPETKYPDGAARRVYYDELLRDLESLPGVARVGLVARTPLTGISNGDVAVRGGPQESLTIDYQLVSAGYFGAMDIPLIRGRLFDERDREAGEHVVVVSQSLARAAWPGDDAIGKQITGGGMDDYWDQEKWATVVGVVGDVHQRNLTEPPRPTLYFSYRQRPYRSWSMTATIRPEDGSASALSPTVRQAVNRIDPEVPVTFATIEARVSRAVADRRFTMLVLGIFGGVAVILASVGIYGVVAYTVARRTREIGIRVALGAEPISVRRLMQRDSLVAAVIGGLAGIGLAAALTRVMRSLLFEVSPTDPLTFVGVVVTVGGVAWLASFVPSLRSTRVDPIEAIRVE